MTLAVEEWKIEKRGRKCSGCERVFASEEEHYSGIVEAGAAFERRDLCLSCWEKKPELFSFWRTRMPAYQERRLENVAAMTDFFRKLTAEPIEDPLRQKIAYLTALLLIRKRRLKLQGSGRGMLRLEKSWDGETMEIHDPPIADDELETLRHEMEKLFEIEIVAGDLSR